MTWVATSSRRQPQPLHHPRLDRGRDRGVGADRAGELADRELLEGVGEPRQVAVGLEGEARQAQAEGGRLGVDPVGAADAERVALLERAVDQRVAVGAGAGEDDLARLAQLQRQGGVEDVGGGEAVVDPAPVLADRGGDDVDEGGDVMVGDPLALVHRLDRECGLRPALRGRLGRAPRPPRPRPRWPPARPRASTPSCAGETRLRLSPGGCTWESRRRAPRVAGCADQRPRSSGGWCRVGLVSRSAESVEGEASSHAPAPSLCPRQSEAPARPAPPGDRTRPPELMR